MTNSVPPPEPSQSSHQRKPILDFDEKVAVIVAFTTIGAIILWSWGVGKNKLFSQTWQKLKSTTEETQVLKTEKTRSLDSRLSIDRELDETKVQILPEDPSQTEQAFDSNLPKTDIVTSQKQKISVGDEQKPIIALPTLPVTPTPPKTVEQPTQPVTPTPPKTVEQPTQPIVTFDDVPVDHWAYPFIEPLIEQELIVGISDTEFQPDLPITRAQLAAEIETAFKQEISRDLINFEDISQDSTVATKIYEAVKKGFLKGYPGQIFRPDQQVPRLQVLVALVSGLDLPTSQDPETTLSSYQDADKIPNWAKEKMATAIESGLVVNRPNFSKNSLYPDASATRAEVVGMIYQGLVKTGRIESISSPYILGPK